MFARAKNLFSPIKSLSGQKRCGNFIVAASSNFSGLHSSALVSQAICQPSTSGYYANLSRCLSSRTKAHLSDDQSSLDSQRQKLAEKVLLKAGLYEPDRFSEDMRYINNYIRSLMLTKLATLANLERCVENIVSYRSQISIGLSFFTIFPKKLITQHNLDKFLERPQHFMELAAITGNLVRSDIDTQENLDKLFKAFEKTSLSFRGENEVFLSVTSRLVKEDLLTQQIFDLLIENHKKMDSIHSMISKVETGGLSEKILLGAIKFAAHLSKAYFAVGIVSGCLLFKVKSELDVTSNDTSAQRIFKIK